MTNRSKFAAKPIEDILFSSTGGRFLCYLLIPAVIPPIKLLYSKTFVNIIRIPLFLLNQHGTSSNVSGISIFLIPMNCSAANTLSLVQNQGLLPACNVLIFFPLILKSIPYRLGCSIGDKSTLCNPQRIPVW